MSTASLPVAKKNEVSVKMNADVYRLVKTLAAWRNVTIADYLGEIVDPVVRRDLKKMQREAARDHPEDDPD